MERVVAGLAAGFDPQWGGFGPAPKFPRPTLVELCLRVARRGGPGGEQAGNLATRTLDAMAAGGIYDHLVGGFCRYATDAHWLVPHFEKMLTDQALLARAYLHAWQDGGRADYLGVVTETLDFVLRDLSTPEGALYSSFDADAGGVEGAHATFTLDELRAVLPTDLVAGGRGLVRHHRRRELGGTQHPGSPRRRAPGPSARDRRGSAPPGGGPRPAGPAGARREGADRVERHGGGDAGRGGGRDRQRALRTPGRGDRRVPHRLHVRRRAPDAQLAGRPGPAPRRGGRPRLARRGLRAPVGVDRAQRVARAGASPSPATSSTCSGTTRPAGSSPPAATPKHSSCDPRNSSTAPSPRPTPSPSPRCCASTHWPTTAGSTMRCERTLALARPLLERHPAALADLVAALPMWSAPQRNRGHRATRRPPLRGPAPLAARRGAGLGRARRGTAVRGSARPSPGQAYVCQARSCLTPAADVATLAGQLEALVA